VPTWGEVSAGDEWDASFDAAIIECGWLPCEGAPGFYGLVTSEGNHTLAKQTDELLMSETPSGTLTSTSPTPIFDKLVAAIERIYDCKLQCERHTANYNGFRFRRDLHNMLMTVDLAHKSRELITTYYPALLDGKRPSKLLPKGENVASFFASLTMLDPTLRAKRKSKDQERFESILGGAKYIEKCAPGLSLPNHMCSCVASWVDPEKARMAGDLVCELVHDYGFMGLTFDGNAAPSSLAKAHLYGNIDLEDGSAPIEVEGAADSTFGHVYKDRYGVLITAWGAAVVVQTKFIGCKTDSSMLAEGMATCHGSEKLEYIHNWFSATGTALQYKMMLATDNKSNLHVATRLGSAANSRHMLRRYVVLAERLERGFVRLVHVPDEENPADFLTKWLPARKLRASVRYATNHGKRVPEAKK